MKKVKNVQPMKEKPLSVTATDAARLREMIWIIREVHPEQEPMLSLLEAKLDGVSLCHAESISGRVVTMNTVARILFLDTERETVFWLGYPEAVNHDGKKLSILTPLGIALLGSRAGDVIDWASAAGQGRLVVTEILYQPEASGDYHL